MDPTPVLTSDSIRALDHLVPLLHVINHRNKNQHRRSVWWRRFSTFRRQVTLLHDEVHDLVKVPASHLERVQLKAERHTIESRVQARLRFWQDVLIAKWHQAFTRLAADGRFTPLGLVLLAALSELCHVSEITRRLEDVAEGEVQKVLHDFGHEQWSKSEHTETEKQPGTVTDHAMADDVGVSLARESFLASSTKPKSRMKVGSKIRRTKKLKRSTGNAIDDLFDGL